MPLSAKTKRLSTGAKIAGVLLLGLVWTGYEALGRWSESHAFMINASESLPNWAFLVEAGKFPRRGEYVVFHPGHDPLVEKYFGAQPEPFAKIAFGLPGDVVSRQGRDVLVNGQKVMRVKPFTRKGDPLEVGPVGVVPKGCVFAGTPHKDGFDSRYSAIGFVCRDRLVGVGRAVL